jgi:hypothetical protein
MRCLYGLVNWVDSTSVEPLDACPCCTNATAAAHKAALTNHVSSDHIAASNRPQARCPLKTHDMLTTLKSPPSFLAKTTTPYTCVGLEDRQQALPAAGHTSGGPVDTLMANQPTRATCTPQHMEGAHPLLLPTGLQSCCTGRKMAC